MAGCCRIFARRGDRPRTGAALARFDTPLAASDVIHAVNGAAVATFAQLSEAMDDLEPNSPVALQVDRGIRLMFVSFVFESLKDKGIVFR